MIGYTLNSRSVEYSESDLSEMTVAQIKALASDLGYSITKVIKADVIREFLAQQG